MQGRALTTDETTRRLVFIGECVEGNITLPNTLRFGQTSNMTVQDLCNSSVATLKKVGTMLEDVQNKAGSSRFSAEAELKVNGIAVSRWIDFIELTAIKKLQADNDARTAERVEALKKELDKLETPQERRTKLEQELATLTGQPAQPAVPTAVA